MTNQAPSTYASEMAQSIIKRTLRLYRNGGLYQLGVHCAAKVARHSGIKAAKEWGHRAVFPVPEDFSSWTHPPDPLAIRYVNPARIDHCTCRGYPPYKGMGRRHGAVMKGDWDRCPPVSIDPDYKARYERLYRDGDNRFNQSTFYRSLEAHFNRDVDWKDTVWYQISLEIMAAGGKASKSMTTKEELQERCRQIDTLFAEIKEKGYLSQQHLGNFPAAKDEVKVDIGRDGTLLFANGRNRLAIAKIQCLPEIPVSVCVRHYEWMRYRDYAAQKIKVRKHPDLIDLPG